MKMLYRTVAITCLTISPLHGSLQITDTLDFYKDFLDDGTYQASCLAKLPIKPKSRHYTFQKAFEHFERYNGRVVVELGTSRSFVHGGLPGCCLDDTRFWEPQNPSHWDWGAGFFTRIACESLAHLKPVIYTIDIDGRAMRRCQIMTQDYAYLINYCVCSSEAFLMRCAPQSIDLLYMDTGNIDHDTAILHLREAKIIVEKNLLSPHGIILIDDVKNFIEGDNSGLGKAKYSIPYFLEHGYEMVENEYQVILRKKESVS